MAAVLACAPVGASALTQADKPTEYTGKEFAQRTLERRAVEAAIWGMPKASRGCFTTRLL